MMKRLIASVSLLLMVAWAWAGETITLPYSLLGKTEFTVGKPTVITSEEDEDGYEMYELTGLGQTQGHIYYSPHHELLLLDGVTLRNTGTQPFLYDASQTMVRLWVKGRNFLTVNGFARIGGILYMSGEGTDDYLNVTSNVYGMEVGSDVTINTLKFNLLSRARGIRNTMQSGKTPILELDNAVVDIEARTACVTGFSEIVTNDCGLSPLTYSGAMVSYDHNRRRLMKDGKECLHLVITCDDGYLPFDTGETETVRVPEHPKAQKAEPVLSAGTRLKLSSMRINGENEFTILRDTVLAIYPGGGRAYALDGIAQEGWVYYVPQSGLLVLRDAVIEGSYMRPFVLSEGDLLIGLEGHNVLNLGNGGIQSSGELNLCGNPSFGNRNTLTIHAKEDMTAIRSVGKTEMSSFRLECDTPAFGIANLQNSKERARLELYYMSGTVSATKAAVDGFSEIYTSACEVRKVGEQKLEITKPEE